MTFLHDLIENAMRHVTSADRCYHYLKELGFDVTRREVREAWRDVGERTAYSILHQTWAELHGFESKPPRWWTASGPAGMTTEYQFLLKYTWLDTEGRIVTDYVSLASDDWENWDDVLQLLSDDIALYVEMSEGALLGIAIGGVIHRGK